jgi:aryl-phospho-beta-D-glucosidase BglC (GH1 family)
MRLNMSRIKTDFLSKGIYMLVMIAVSCSILACGSNVNNLTVDTENIETDKVVATTQNPSIVYASEDMSVEELYKDMGNGMSLGNDLDVCDWDAIGSNKAIGYQAAAIYTTNPYSTWNASSYQYFSYDGSLHFVWNIESLNSENSTICDSFAIQIVSHESNAQNKAFTCSITNATFTTATGAKYTMGSLIGTHQLTIKNDVTQYLYQPMSTFDGVKTTGDVIGGKIEIDLKLEDFYYDVSSEISKLETYWGNPVATEDMIKAISDRGFKTIRIPVTYFNHMSDEGTIDTAFLDRVEEVVDWALKYDMYVIMSIQHDTGNDGWIKASESNYKNNKTKVEYMVRQIAEKFKDKDNHLILEGFNEMVNDKCQWDDYIPDKDLSVMNRWNQLFVDTVRATEGNNTDRYLLVNTYAAMSTKKVLDAFVLPSDTANNKILVGLHCYFNNDNMDQNFAVMTEFVEKYNVIIGEWAFWISKEGDNRIEGASRYMEYVNALGIPAIWWDNGNTNEMAIFDRKTLSWPNEELVDLIIDI